MFHPKALQAALVGCLATLACFCALQARGGENYSIVAQSNRASAATGRRPLAERIAAANLPIITHASGNTSVARTAEPGTSENVAVAAVVVDEKAGSAEAEPTAEPPQQSGKQRSPQATVRALWKAATGLRSGTVTR